MPLVILTGASGAGKTTIAEAIERLHSQEIDVFYKDRIGVPPVQEMIDEFGSVEGWQRAATLEWMARLSPLVTQGRSVLFEGQSRFAFLVEAAERAGIVSYACILIDCDDETRTRRLSIDRGQPDLASVDMMNWARFLRNEASEYGCEILDTSNLTLEQGVEHVLRVLRRQRVQSEKMR
ncbi:AAA family ATPase [Rhizobium sp. PRIMUS64]|uniref:AAA family ATPase n=1 Tax=Rhizobium sp. PRIMUS64 TaxID=2908925 RepID=UPI001FF32CA5|nr:AAA family ATPase [Rhizobium sp. PRIMUS64]MCJ9694900.1 AAA family ATPase [Rhizobium sp. PRIMUS64]